MKSIIRNLTTAFFAGLISTILLFIYVFHNTEASHDDDISFWVFLTILLMGICSFLGFLGLSILSVISSIYKWPEGLDYLSKIIFALALYLPLFFIMQTIEWIHSFWYWSLIGTLLVISFDYKSLFAENFTISRSSLQIDNHK